MNTLTWFIQNIIKIYQVRFIRHCLNFLQQLIQIRPVIPMILSFNISKGPHLINSAVQSDVLSDHYSSLPKFTSEAHSYIPSQIYSLLLKTYASIQVKAPTWFLKQLTQIRQVRFIHLYPSFIQKIIQICQEIHKVHSNIPSDDYSSLPILVSRMLPLSMTSSAHYYTLNATLSLEPSSTSRMEE